MESISIANKILQDPARSYKILPDTRKKCYGININSKQHPTRFYGILEKNGMESISIANNILQDPRRSYKILRDTRQKCFGIHINSKQDPTRSYKILQDPRIFYGILDKNAMESISIANKILHILRDTRQKCYGIHINRKQDPTRFYGILDKNALESISIANKILKDSTGYLIKMLWNPYQ